MKTRTPQYTLTGCVTLVVLLAAAPGFVSASPADDTVLFETWPAGSFSSDRSIGVVRGDGSGYQILFTGGFNHTPKFSPDGENILFFHQQGSESAVYMMGADGSNPHPVLTGPSNQNDGYVAWAPSGDRFAHVADYLNVTSSISIVSVDGTVLHQMDMDHWSHQVDWTPDSQYLYFAHQTGVSWWPTSEIYRIHSDLTEMTQLTNDSVGDLNLDVSPDGGKLLWRRDLNSDPHDGWTLRPFVADLIGGDIVGMHELGNIGVDCHGAVWSRDGSAVFCGFGQPNQEAPLWLMDADGANLRSVLQIPGYCMEPTDAIPEPATLALVGLGTLVLFHRRR